MTVSIRCNYCDRDTLYEYGHGMGLSTMPDIIEHIVHRINSGSNHELYISLGSPVKIAKPLKGKKINKSVYKSKVHH